MTTSGSHAVDTLSRGPLRAVAATTRERPDFEARRVDGADVLVDMTVRPFRDGEVDLVLIDFVETERDVHWPTDASAVATRQAGARNDAGATLGRDTDADAAVPSLAGLRILIVEDSRDALEPFIELLQLEGAMPTAAGDANDAIAWLERQDFDLIVSDIAMPEVSGYEFIAEVRRRPRSASTPAIALTGFGRDDDRRRALDAGFDVHLSKPASILDLRRALVSLRDAEPGSARLRRREEPRFD